MPYSIWGFIAEIPWWLYIVFLLVINASYQASKPRQVSLKAFIILPVFAILMMFFSMMILVNFDSYRFSLMAAAIAPGAILGWIQFRIRNIKAVKNQSQFYVPGTWSLPLFFLALICLKFYYFGFNFIFDPGMLKQENFLTLMVGLCGLVIGLSVGRAFYLFRTMKFGPFLENP